MSIVINILLAIHVIVSLFIVLFVLMQRPKNEGLGAAFGGGMTENLFGAQTTNVLQTITRWLGGIFFALTLLLSWMYVKQTNGKSSVQKRLNALSAAPAVAPKAPATPAPDAKALPGKTSAPASDKPKTPEAPMTPTTAKPPASVAPSTPPMPAPTATPAAPSSSPALPGSESPGPKQ